MNNFNDLVFSDISEDVGGDAIQAMVVINDKYLVSIVRHHFSYGGEDGLYEIGVFDGDTFNMCDPLGWGDDVKGFLSPEGVTAELNLLEENSSLECFECNSSDYERVTKDYDSFWGPTGIAIHVPDVVHLICPVCGDCILDEVALAKIDEVIERVREQKGNDNE